MRRAVLVAPTISGWAFVVDGKEEFTKFNLDEFLQNGGVVEKDIRITETTVLLLVRDDEKKKPRRT